MTTSVPVRRAAVTASLLLIAGAALALALADGTSSTVAVVGTPVAESELRNDAAHAQGSLASTYAVCLQPLGKHDGTLIEPIRRGIAQAYGFRVRRLADRPLPNTAWYPPRSRYRAQRILDHLVSDVVRVETGCNAVMGFTAVDVSITKGEHPDWGVLGLAYQGGRVGVVSSFRMRRDADRRRIVERAVKVVNHELGHVVGLPHRDDGPACLMNDAGGSVQSIDRARGTLCAAERAAAEATLGFDLPVREQLDWDAILGH